MQSSDPLDIASEQEQIDRDAALQAIRDLANTPEAHPDFDGETCVSCGDNIPPARLAMGRVRCVICQSRIEQQRRM